jgi:tRNA synthetases class I (E and Q), catalytic domain
MGQQVRTRFAPSSTGYLHIGGVRTGRGGRAGVFPPSRPPTGASGAANAAAGAVASKGSDQMPEAARSRPYSVKPGPWAGPYSLHIDFESGSGTYKYANQELDALVFPKGQQTLTFTISQCSAKVTDPAFRVSTVGPTGAVATVGPDPKKTALLQVALKVADWQIANSLANGRSCSLSSSKFAEDAKANPHMRGTTGLVLVYREGKLISLQTNFSFDTPPVSSACQISGWHFFLNQALGLSSQTEVKDALVTETQQGCRRAAQPAR